MTDTDTPRRRKLSKLAKRLLWAAVPISVLLGFAIWVHGKTTFTPDFLEKHGFKFGRVFEHYDFEELIYLARVPLARVQADFEAEMTSRGFEIERKEFEGLSIIEVSNGGIMLGYLQGVLVDTGPTVEFHQYKIHSFPHRVQLATGWRFIP